MKIFECEYMSKEVTEVIAKEQNTSVSNENHWIITTNEIFYKLVTDNIIQIVHEDYMGNDNNITLDALIFDDLEQWIQCQFMGETCKFFNEEIYLTECAESVRVDIDYLIEKHNFLNTENDWVETIHDMLKQDAIMEVSRLLTEEIMNLELDGYNVACLK